MKPFCLAVACVMCWPLNLMSALAVAAEASDSVPPTEPEQASGASDTRPADATAPQVSPDAGSAGAIDAEGTTSAPGIGAAGATAAQPAEVPALPQPAPPPAPAPEAADSQSPQSDLSYLSLSDLLEIRVPEVSGVSKMREDARQVPMSVYIVTREELDRWGTRGNLETLQRVPGYSYYNIDQYGQYGAISRGLYSIWRFGQSIELMPFKDHGHTTFAPRMYQSVEVARGPSGLTWGRSASAGLINYNLRDDLDGGEATFELGDHARRATDVMYGARFGRNDNFFVGFHYEEQGFETQTVVPFESRPLWRSNGIEPSYIFASRIKYKALKALFYYESSAHPVPHVWFAYPQGMEDALAARGHAYPVDRMPNLNWRLELHAPTEEITTRLSFVKALDPYFYFNGMSSEWWVDDVVGIRNNKYDLGLQLNGALFENNRVRFSIGGDFWSRFTDSDETMTTNWAHDDFGVTWFDGQYQSPRQYSRNIFAQVSVEIVNRLSVVAGGRLEYLRDEINNGQPGPANAWSSTSDTIVNATRLGAIYMPHRSTTLKYMFNTTKRPPAYNEKFNSQALRSELTSAHEIIAMFQWGKNIQADITVAYQSLSGMINRLEGDNFNTYANVGNANTWAIEWDGKYRAIPQLLLYWNGSWNRARGASSEVTLNGVTTVTTPPTDAQQRLRFVPALTSFVGAEYAIAGIVSVNADFRAIAQIPYRTSSGCDALASAYFVDASVRTKKFWKTISASLSALNLFDAKPNLPAFGEHSGNVNGTLQPEGRRVMGRLTANF